MPDEGFASPERVTGLDKELYFYLDQLRLESPSLPSTTHADSVALPGPGAAQHQRNEQTRFTLESSLRSLLQEELPKIQEDWPLDKVRAEILYFNAEQSTLEQIAQVRFTGTRETMRVRKLSLSTFDGEGICAYAARMRETVQAPNVRFDRRYKQVLEGEDRTLSELAIPLTLGHRLLGILNLESDAPRTFGNRVVERLEDRAPMLALLLDYETYRFEEEVMTGISARLAGLTDEDAILAEVLKTALDLTGQSSLGCVFKPDREENPQRLQVTRNRGLDLNLGDERRIEPGGLIARALQDPTGMSYWSQHEHGLDGHAPLDRGIMSEFVTVVLASRRVIAILDIASRRPALSERHRRLARRCADLAGSLIEGLRLRGKEEREKALELALQGVGYAAHLARGVLGLLRGNLNTEAQLSEESKTYYDAIQERLEASEQLIESFQQPSRPLKLSEIIARVRSRAMELALPLDVMGEFDVTVVGNLVGFDWLFDNLLSNSKRHVDGKDKAHAYLLVQGDKQHGKLTYWDNGHDPTAIERFLSGKTKRKGWRHVKALCRLYGWQVEPKSGSHGELAFEFSFPWKEARIHAGEEA
jgi:putative methionine-R-sulfoxide reductase with GAF domain